MKKIIGILIVTLLMVPAFSSSSMVNNYSIESQFSDSSLGLFGTVFVKEEILSSSDTLDKMFIYDEFGDLIRYIDDFSRSQYNRMKCGDVVGDDMDEILIAEDFNEYVWIYDRYGNLLDAFDVRYTEDDGFACGDVDGDGKDEIITAGSSHHNYKIFKGDGSLVREFTRAAFIFRGFECGDINGDGKDEILAADTGSHDVHIYNQYGDEINSFDCGFDTNDEFDCGDINGDGKDEILVVGDQTGLVDVFNEYGEKIPLFYSAFKKNDGFKCGDVNGDGKDEIIVGRDSLSVYIYDENGDEIRRLDIEKCVGEYDLELANLVKENSPPNRPNKPSGPSSGKVGTTYTYKTKTIDPDGDQVAFKFDFGDEVTSYGSFVDSGTYYVKTSVWTDPGTYAVKAKAKDETGAESDWSEALMVTISDVDGNQPPNKPDRPTGKDRIRKLNSLCVYGATISDPDGDKVTCAWDWGDGSEIYWYEIYKDSGSGFAGYHAWQEGDICEVRVKARDEHGLEGEWSDPLVVTISKSKAYNLLDLCELLMYRFPFIGKILNQIIL